MSENELIKRIGKYGNIECIKKDVVCTVFLTGKDLSKVSNILDIQDAVNKFASKEYPFIEVYKNTDEFFLLILKQ